MGVWIRDRSFNVCLLSCGAVAGAAIAHVFKLCGATSKGVLGEMAEGCCSIPWVQQSTESGQTTRCWLSLRQAGCQEVTPAIDRAEAELILHGSTRVPRSNRGVIGRIRATRRHDYLAALLSCIVCRAWAYVGGNVQVVVSNHVVVLAGRGGAEQPHDVSLQGAAVRAFMPCIVSARTYQSDARSVLAMRTSSLLQYGCMLFRLRDGSRQEQTAIHA